MWRKMISVLFALILVLGLTVTVSAKTMWYYIDDLEMAVPIPDDMSFLSRDMSADDPLLVKMGQTRETILAVFNKNNVYLQLWKNDFSCVVNISMTPSSLKDMNDFNQTEWGSFVVSIIDEFDYADVSDIMVCQSDQGTFAQFSIYVYNGVDYIYSYYYVTVYRGKKIVIQLFSQSGSPTSSQQEAFNSIVDDIYFGSEEEIFGSSSESTASNTAAFTYYDNPVNTSFTVPANWYSEVVTGTDPFVTAVFVSYENEDAVIVYGSEDQWSDYSSLSGITRADINNNYFTEKQIEDKFEFTTDVSIKYVNGVKYFTFKSYSGNMVSTSMIMYHNAVFYWFEFYGDENNPYYGDFISLLKSVKYPAVSTPASSKSSSSQSKPVSSQASSSQSVPVSSVSVPTSSVSIPASSASVPASSDGDEGSPTAAIRAFNTKNEGFYIAIAAVLFALPMIIYRYAVRKRPVDSKQAMEIVLIYGAVSLAALAAVAAFLDGSWVAVGMVLIWHIASYFILTSGQKQPQYNGYITVGPQNQTQYNDFITIEPQNQTREDDDFITIEPQETHNQSDSFLHWQQPAVSNEIPKTVKISHGNSGRPQFCEMCGSKLKKGSKFCAQCGEKIEV